MPDRPTTPSHTVRPRRPTRQLEAGARHAGNTLAGLVIIALALASWSATWVLGGRDIADGLLLRDLSSVTGLEVAMGGLFLFGLLFVAGVAWTTGTTGRTPWRKDRRP